jgi:hypothetical protein
MSWLAPLGAGAAIAHLGGGVAYLAVGVSYLRTVSSRKNGFPRLTKSCLSPFAIPIPVFATR